MRMYRTGFARPAAFRPAFDELRDELDRLWTSLTAAPPLHGWSAGRPTGSFPAVNVRETDAAVMVEAELPGLAAGDVSVTVVEDELLLQGARPAADEPPVDAGPVTWHRRERGSGGFERRLRLPVAVDAAAVEARLVDGVLTVTCPKAPQCQPRKVEVRTA